MALNIALLCGQSQLTMLASSASAPVTYLNGTTNPTSYVVTMGSLPPIPQVPSALWIWGSACNNCIGCSIHNTFHQSFKMLCPGAAHTLYAQGAQKYNFTILGQTGGAANKTFIQNYTIKTTSTTCGQTVTLDIYATSLGPCTSRNISGLRYGIIVPDCTKGCNATAFYNPKVCLCQACTSFDPKCKSCEWQKCLTCLNGATPSATTGKCP
jgi:hypothetical protein